MFTKGSYNTCTAIIYVYLMFLYIATPERLKSSGKSMASILLKHMVLHFPQDIECRNMWPLSSYKSNQQLKHMFRTHLVTISRPHLNFAKIPQSSRFCIFVEIRFCSKDQKRQRLLSQGPHRGTCPIPVTLPVIVILICPHLDPSDCFRLMMLFSVLTNNAVTISMQKIHKKWKQIFCSMGPDATYFHN